MFLASALVPAAANAGLIRIEIGDRGYYRGATYWDNEWEMGARALVASSP